jgi:pilus assembly protein CpaE
LLTSLTLTTDENLSVELREASVRCKHVRIDRTISRRLSSYEAVHLVNTMEPDVVFLDFATPEWGREMASAMAASVLQVAVVGIRRRIQQVEIDENAAATWVDWPAREGALDEAAVRAVRSKIQREDWPFFAFLPSKAGSGASTVALHVADAFANQLGKHTLLMDADLRSGVVSIYLNLQIRQTMRDALAQSAELQPAEWRAMVSQVQKLDVIGNYPAQGGQLPMWTDYYKLLQFALPRYEALVADLPELTNEATSEIVRRCRKVFLVVTAELPSLKLALLRIKELKLAGAEEGQLAVVLNRWHRNDLPIRDVEQVLERPLAAILPNDYKSVKSAISRGGSVNPETPLGRAYLDFSSRLLEKRDSEPVAEPKRDWVRELFGGPGR